MTYRCQKSDVGCQKRLSRFLTFVLCILISVYRYSFAFIFGGQCRFTPSCSAYAIEAIEAFGPLKGMRLAVGRICRCHPWGGHGYDPVQKAGFRGQDSGIREARRKAFPDC